MYRLTRGPDLSQVKIQNYLISERLDRITRLEIPLEADTRCIRIPWPLDNCRNFGKFSNFLRICTHVAGYRTSWHKAKLTAQPINQSAIRAASEGFLPLVAIPSNASASLHDWSHNDTLQGTPSNQTHFLSLSMSGKTLMVPICSSQAHVPDCDSWEAVQKSVSALICWTVFLQIVFAKL